jgi:predicted O-linked N-acetylglucosamine transferase (SPINDLY family)
MPDVYDRVIFVPQQKGLDFLNLLAVSDVILDTIHFNGMNTSLEGFAAGTPIVTMPTAFQRGRHTSGMYRKMGMDECIARTPEEYINIAVRLGCDLEFRRHVKQRIAERSNVLYEDINVVREFERFFTTAVGDRKPN